MHGMHGPTVFGYALMPANLVPRNGLNSSTALWEAWESQRQRKKIQTENPREETQIYKPGGNGFMNCGKQPF